MKKSLVFLNQYLTPILVIILISTSFYLWNETKIQSSRIDTLNKTLYDVAAHKKEIYKEIQLTQFKEDYYLNQLSNSTTLIMTMIAIVIALGGLITFKTIYDNLNTYKRAIETQLESLNNTNTEIKSLKDRIDLNQSSLNLTKKEILQKFKIDYIINFTNKRYETILEKSNFENLLAATLESIAREIIIQKNYQTHKIRNSHRIYDSTDINSIQNNLANIIITKAKQSPEQVINLDNLLIQQLHSEIKQNINSLENSNQKTKILRIIKIIDTKIQFISNLNQNSFRS